MRPRAVLLDTRLPRAGAAHAIDQLLTVRPDVRVIAVTACGDEEQELALFLAGARGVCALDAEPVLLRQAVEAVLCGELWIRRGLVQQPPRLGRAAHPDAVSMGLGSSSAPIEVLRLLRS
jgi:DNA-binding NarL/FixJ family response regulator